MWFRILLFLLCLALPACGGNDFRVGPTTFYVMDGAELTIWRDLPEAVHEMQQVPGAPDDTWDVDVMLYPEWHPVGKPGNACEYEWSLDRIEVRVSGDTTADGCLPHEFAHRWLHEEVGLSALQGDNAHNDAWRTRTATLTAAARKTWAHRK